ncbi:MAG: DUF4139 domain-containing protein [Novosphingobium sp.]|nr:DUF4139 domain-containing protein [Novosphingobium sp.]
MNRIFKAASCTAAIGLAALASQFPALAQNGEASAQGDVSVTIYNNNLALVQDIRQLNIAAGRSKITFPDVSAKIRPETLSFAARGTAIVEQNFDFDLLTPTKMMEKAIGQTVTLLRTNPATGVERRERAKVLSTSGGVVVQIGSRIEVLRDDGLPVRVIFDRVPPNLRARPTLSVNVQSRSAGTRPASIRYLTPGIGWSADYVALYDEGKGTIDMQGWVTLTNNTGTTFRNASTLLIAGNPAQANRSSRSRRPSRKGTGGIRPGTQSANREQVGDFYLYPIANRTTIANAQTKQVSFLDVQGVPARKVYGRTVSWMQSDSDAVNVASQIAFSSSSDGGLGDALPSGTVRFYQRDRKGSPQFIGENAIPHTPMGSELNLRTGDAFDITLQAEVEKRERITSDEFERYKRWQVIKDGEIVSQGEVSYAKTYYRTTMRYKLTNAKSSSVNVELIQAGLDWGWWAQDYRVVSEDVPGEQLNADRRKFVISVPANGEREVRVTYATRY